MHSLIAHNLTVKRSSRLIFAPVDFEMIAGELLLFKGENGAGKSTLLRAMIGFLPFHTGEIYILSSQEKQSDEKSELTPDILHYLGHKDPIKPSLSVKEQLIFWRSYLAPCPAFSLKSQRYDDIEAALERLQLHHVKDIPGGYLSQGQKRRISIARLLLSPRPLWLLDEPTAGLDAKAEAIFGEIVQQHLDAGGLCIAATHLDLPILSQKEVKICTPAFEESLLDEEGKG